MYQNHTCNVYLWLLVAILFCLRDAADKMARPSVEARLKKNAVLKTKNPTRARMLSKADDAVRIQREYYAATASRYDEMHAHEGDDDYRSVRLVDALFHMIQPKSVLDVGAGTGRGVLRLLDTLPNTSICGVEPVAALIDQALKKGVPKTSIIRGTGEALPFADGSFDLVCSFALLHHVPSPNVVLREMLRVARKAVIVVDGNRFGQGRMAMRWLKLALFKTRLWKLVNLVKTGGKGYLITPGDGLAYSYSVYDTFDYIADWADELIVVPAEACKPVTWLHPLLTASHVLVCAIKNSETGVEVVRDADFESRHLLKND